jgi:hypothetical protein
MMKYDMLIHVVFERVLFEDVWMLQDAARLRCLLAPHRRLYLSAQNLRIWRRQPKTPQTLQPKYKPKWHLKQYEAVKWSIYFAWFWINER